MVGGHLRVEMLLVVAAVEAHVHQRCRIVSSRSADTAGVVEVWTRHVGARKTDGRPRLWCNGRLARLADAERARVARRAIDADRRGGVRFGARRAGHAYLSVANLVDAAVGAESGA